MLVGWGVFIDDPATEFAAIDTDGSGVILFDEFAGWALSKNLDPSEGSTIVGESELVNLHKTTKDMDGSMESMRRQAAKNSPPKPSPRSDAKSFKMTTAGIDLPALIKKLPFTERDAAAQKNIFAKMDGNGNGHLTLSEVCCRDSNLVAVGFTSFESNNFRSDPRTTDGDGYALPARNEQRP